MPEIIEKMVKPAEKIKGISINTINGPGRASGGGEGTPATNQIIDAIMDMAVSMPAMKKIGDAIGVNIEGVSMDEEKKSPG
jgi:hypothetical protein